MRRTAVTAHLSRSSVPPNKNRSVSCSATLQREWIVVWPPCRRRCASSAFYPDVRRRSIACCPGSSPLRTMARLGSRRRIWVVDRRRGKGLCIHRSTVAPPRCRPRTVDTDRHCFPGSSWQISSGRQFLSGRQGTMSASRLKKRPLSGITPDVSVDAISQFKSLFDGSQKTTCPKMSHSLSMGKVVNKPTACY